jgi:hypothetical protein
VQTDQNSVIGGYCPEQWEDTTGKKCSSGIYNHKDIASGLPFLFYWVNGQIQIIKHRDDKIPNMRSDKNWLMGFGRGLAINADQNRESTAYASNYDWVHP